MRYRLLAIVAVLTTVATLLAAWWAEERFAPDGQIVVSRDVQSADLRSEFLFLPDMEQSPADLIRAFRAGELLPTLDAALEQVVPYQAVWAVAEVTEGADAPRTWRIVSDIYGVVGAQVWLVPPDGAARQVLDYSARAPVRPGQYTGSVLRSGAFMLPPGQPHLVVAAIKRGPVASAALVLETESAMIARAVGGTMALSLFYGVSLAALVFFLAFVLAMKSPGGFGYAALSFLGLGFVAYLDGLTFRLVYPALPQVHLPFGLTLLFLINAVGFQVAAMGVQEYGPGNRTLRRAMGVGVLVSAACIVLVFVMPPEMMAPVSYGLVVLMFAGQLASSVLWTRLSGAFPLAIDALSAFCAAAALAIVILLFTGRLDGALDPGTMVRAFYAVIAIWVISGVTVGLVDLRHQHAASQASEIAALKQAADTASELLEAEQNYSRARDLARTRSRQLASASHDLKQPIASLRLTMDSIARDQPAEVRDRLSEAFDYMQSLSQGYLDETTADADLDASPDPEPPADVETFTLGLVLDTVGQMFREEAISKGLTLRIARSTLSVHAPTMTVMRIVSNLASNAVKYTNQGGVLIGARRVGTEAEIVVFDTGPGMTAAQLETYVDSYQKGETSDGTGLGLAICTQLADANGLDLSVRSVPGQGTCFRLRVPRAGADGKMGD